MDHTSAVLASEKGKPSILTVRLHWPKPCSVFVSNLITVRYAIDEKGAEYLGFNGEDER